MEHTPNTVNLGFVELEYLAPDVVILTYMPKIHLTWDMTLEVFKATNKLTGNKACYMCSVIGNGLTIEKEVREKGVTPEMLKYTKAAAIVQNSLAHKLLANFIIRVQRPQSITKAFSTKEAALKWFDELRDLENKNLGNKTSKGQLML